MEESKWSSRKLFVMGTQFIILLILPLIYKRFEIGEAVLLTVLGSSSTLAGLYLGVNVLQKKYLASPDDGSV